MDWKPLPSRIDECPERVRIAGDGREGTVSLVYYDRLHTGDSYDELTVKLDNGCFVRGPAHQFEAPIGEGVTAR